MLHITSEMDLGGLFSQFDLCSQGIVMGLPPCAIGQLIWISCISFEKGTINLLSQIGQDTAIAEQQMKLVKGQIEQIRQLKMVYLCLILTFMFHSSINFSTAVENTIFWKS